MGKSADAFRTISEVADWLEVPAHVLRFWESKFTQVKPVKRAGGRRYYRPADMRLLGGIKVLLHDEGLTIKGVQKMLREQGVSHVAALSPPFAGDAAVPEPPPVAQVLTFARPDDAQDAGTDGTGHTVADEVPPGPATEPDAAPEAEPAPDRDAGADPEPGMTADPAPEQAAARDESPDSPAASDTAPATEPEAASGPEPEAASEPDSDTSAAPDPVPPAPALLPLPDLPPDPPDDVTAAPGALARLAALPRPLPARLAPGLSALAERLRAAGTPKP